MQSKGAAACWHASTSYSPGEKGPWRLRPGSSPSHTLGQSERSGEGLPAGKASGTNHIKPRERKGRFYRRSKGTECRHRSLRPGGMAGSEGSAVGQVNAKPTENSTHQLPSLQVLNQLHLLVWCTIISFLVTIKRVFPLELVISICVCVCSPFLYLYPLTNPQTLCLKCKASLKIFKYIKQSITYKSFFMELSLLEPSVLLWFEAITPHTWDIPAIEETSSTDILGTPCVSFSWIRYLPPFWFSPSLWWNIFTKRLPETGTEGYFYSVRLSDCVIILSHSLTGSMRDIEFEWTSVCFQYCFEHFWFSAHCI